MPDIMKYIMDDTAFETDPDGYLMNLDDWSEKIAIDIAAQEDIQLLEQHWEIIYFLRDYYKEYGTSPNVRLLMKVLTSGLGKDKGNRKYLYNLFQQGPSRQGCKIAGLPLPNDCIDYS